MKRTLTVFTVIFLFFLICVKVYSQSLTFGELMIVNNSSNISGKLIKVNIYPVGAIFSGGKQYTLDATNPIDQSNNKIFGYSGILNYDQSQSEDQWTLKINFDATADIQFCKTSLGYGKYRIDFYEGPDVDNFVFADYCIVDYSDANYGTNNFQGEQKIRIDYRSNSNITFNFLSNTTAHDINEVGKEIKVWEQFGSGFSPVIPSKGIFNDTAVTQYQNFPVDAKQFGAVDHINPGDFSLNMTAKYSGSNLRQDQALNFYRSEFTISDGMTFPVNQAASINISGKGSRLIGKNNSHIIVPSGFVINLSDSSELNMDGTVITTSGGNPWRGIRMQNTGAASFIRNSTFENADTLVYMSDQMGRPFKFENNIVNVSRSGPGYRYVLNFKNTFNLFISGNEFHLPPVDVSGIYREGGVHVSNYQNLNSGARVCSINLNDNKFFDGYYHFNLLGFASNLVPFNVTGNTFNRSFYSVVLRKCIGDVKNNIFIQTMPFQDLTPSNCLTNLSVVNYYQNQFQSENINIISHHYSYSNLAPIRNAQNQIVWTAGLNTLKSSSSVNISSQEGGYIFTNFGKNSFTIENTLTRHIYGTIDDSVLFYYANGNCWFGNNAQASIELYNSLHEIIPYQANSGHSCFTNIEPEGYLVFDDQFGIQDSVPLSESDVVEEIPESEIKFAGSIRNISSNNLNEACNDLKVIIGDYDENKYSVVSMQKLFDLYCERDNESGQVLTNQLFGDLKSFLENAVGSKTHSETFVRIAGDIILMCETKLKNYNNALAGYEYIAMNDPDSYNRISASTEYLAVSALMNGSGGGSKLNKKREMPVNKVLKNLYKKEALKNKYRKVSEAERKQTDTKVREILNCKVLNKEDRIKKIEEVSLSQMMQSRENSADVAVNNKRNINLLQNYPNPFNPVTKIIFEIPEDNNISLIIYDVSGKEVNRLVNNEFRMKGKYSVDFNALNYSSGIYFYQLRAGNIVQTRQMILLK